MKKIIVLVIFGLSGCINAPVYEFYNLDNDINSEYYAEYEAEPKYGIKKEYQADGTFKDFLIVSESRIALSSVDFRRKEMSEAFDIVYKDKCDSSFFKTDTVQGGLLHLGRFTLGKANGGFDKYGYFFLRRAC